MKTSIILPVLLNLAMASAARPLASWEQTPETILNDNPTLDITCKLNKEVLECATDKGANPRQENLLPLCKEIGGCGCSPMIGNRFSRRFGGNDFSFTFACRSLQKELDIDI
ncbi:hypothetical protein VB005_06696 [Metarhizium brunneum]|jgi:hypothetical protein